MVLTYKDKEKLKELNELLDNYMPLSDRELELIEGRATTSHQMLLIEVFPKITNALDEPKKLVQQMQQDNRKLLLEISYLKTLVPKRKLKVKQKTAHKGAEEPSQ